MKNTEKLLYTWYHRYAILQLYYDVLDILKNQNDFDIDLKKLHKSLKYHDFDKCVLLLLQDRMEIEIPIKTIHTNFIGLHHVENKSVTLTPNQIIEMILDWESAGLTKEDKPLNAFDTLHTYYKQYAASITPFLELLGMNYSYDVKTKHDEIYELTQFYIKHTQIEHILKEMNKILFF